MSVVDKKKIEDVLGEEAVEEIIDKDWKVAELPSEEELEKEKHKSPKARSNVNSRKNLIQYRKNKPREAKKRAVQNLESKSKRRNINPFDFIKMESSEKRDLFSSLLPFRTILATAEEEEFLYRMINSLLFDFDIEELSVSDMDDIINLALNRVMIDRLYEDSKREPTKILDIAASVERFKKESKVLKQNLASRRSDRIDPKGKQNFSITDLVYAYDDDKRREFEERVEKLDKEKRKYKDKKKISDD